jgi:hypothetical protein
LTLGLVVADRAVQLRVAETNVQRVVAACEAYHAANGKFPKKTGRVEAGSSNAVAVPRYSRRPDKPAPSQATSSD